MSEVAKHRIALRSPSGQRVEVPPGAPLPAWVPEATRNELRAVAALEFESTAEWAADPVAAPVDEPVVEPSRPAGDESAQAAQAAQDMANEQDVTAAAARPARTRRARS